MPKTINQSYEERTQLLVLIDKELIKINKAFISTPEDVDLTALKVLYNQVKETNREIKESQEARTKHWIASNCGKWTVRGVLAATFICTIAFCVLGIIIAVKAKKDSIDRALGISSSALSGAAGVGQITWVWMTRIEDAHEAAVREKRFMKRLDERHAVFFEQLVPHFQNLRENPQNRRASGNFRDFLTAVNELPDDTIQDLQIAPKPVWIATAAKIQQRQNPRDELSGMVVGGIETITKKCNEKPSKFVGEQSGNGIRLEPISTTNAEIEVEFSRFDNVLGCKLAYIPGGDGKYYNRQGKAFDTWQEAEQGTRLVVVNL